MADKRGSNHVVVDGSNLATEGRSMPSLAQLEDAVASYMEEFPDAQVTVVVDATFAHRIDKSEVKRYEEGIENNELVAPPAGAVGRGDAFVLGIADKAGSIVLSNDSFQEFHGEYPWLFDDGRLIGGKPVPHVGWVWVERNPVRGPVSRKATRDAKSSRSSRSSSASSESRSKRGGRGKRTASKEASQPMPVPSSPPPSAKRSTDEQGDSSSTQQQPADAVRKPAPKGGDPVNEVMPFLEFVEKHPAGTTVTGVVDAYSSHGAYVTIDDVRGYVPLRMMADPAPRSAKKVLSMGEAVDLVVVSFAPARRSIDCALPDMAEQMLAEAAESGDTPSEEPAERRPARRRSAKRSAKKVAASAAATASPADAEDSTTTKELAGRKAAAKKSTAAKRKSPAKKKAAAKKTATKKTATKKATAKKAAAKKAAAKKATTKKAATKKAATKKTASRKAAAKKTAAKKAAAKKTTTRTRSASRKTAASKTADSA